MGIIPVINCTDFANVKETLEKAKTFLPEENFLHLDIADGSMTFNKTWGNPTEWAGLRAPYQLEVHLMSDHPERAAGAWIAAGARRFIIHVETLTDESFAALADLCSLRGIGLALSSNPETTVDRLAPWLKYFPMFQVLCVHPGLAGQPFLPLVLEKIAWLCREYPNAIIETDGGMNSQTVGFVKAAGANIAVSSSFIFNDSDPKQAYEILKNS